MSGITLSNISKTYPGGVKAVDRLNLDIGDREFLVLVGPSGCGKTTTLRMVAGLEDITGGELFIGDEKANHIPAKGRDLAMVFQNFALYPHMTVFENMAFSLKIRRVPKPQIEKRIFEAARLLGIESLLSRRPKELSGGQMQRVALGRAIVRNPKAFLMDEPLSNLDAKMRAQMRAELIKLHKDLQTTFIYVTHDQAEAMTMGTRIAVLNDGLLQQADTPANLYDYPANMFVAGFIGTPQMNFFPVLLEASEDGLVCDFKGTRIALPEGIKGRLADGCFIGRDVVMGVRPEHMRLEEDFVASHPGSTLLGSFEMAEMMGAETLVHMNIQGVSAVLRAARYNAPAGTAVRVALEPANIHLFDPGTQESILKKG
jgi:multiple sugar transport system ATP-binding protein